MAALEDAVSKDDDGTWRFTCGAPAGTCAPFVSSGWPTKASAVERGREHADEHATGTLMTPMADFLEKHGLTTDDNGKAVSK